MTDLTIPNTLNSYAQDSETEKLIPGLNALFELTQGNFLNGLTKKLEDLQKTSNTVSELYIKLGSASASMSLTSSILGSINFGSVSGSLVFPSSASISSLPITGSITGSITGLETHSTYLELQERMAQLTQQRNLPTTPFSSSSSSPVDSARSEELPIIPSSSLSVPTSIDALPPLSIPPSIYLNSTPLPLPSSSLTPTSDPAATPARELPIDNSATDSQPLPPLVPEADQNQNPSLSVLVGEFDKLLFGDAPSIPTDQTPPYNASSPASSQGSLIPDPTLSSSSSAIASPIMTTVPPLASFKAHLEEYAECCARGMSESANSPHPRTERKRLKKEYTTAVKERFKSVPSAFRATVYEKFLFAHNKDFENQADQDWVRKNFCKYEQFGMLSALLIEDLINNP
jgi:hypothetical protein